MKYDKLVRDKIPEIIEKDGKKAVTRELTDEEYKIYLEKKLDEEVAEFHESKSLEELADITEVIEALCKTLGYTKDDLWAVKWNKKYNRGNFSRKVLLEEIRDEREGDTEIIKSVIIPARDNHDGVDAVLVSLKWVCPVCGKPRGEIKKVASYDGSRYLPCDGWINPCGHVDKYDAVRKEAAENGLN